MTAKTFNEALAEEARRGDEHRAQIRTEGWRAGAEAMRGAAEAAATRRERAYRPVDPNYADGCKDTARDIRELTVPEMPNG